jgi:hypothetical protein
MLCDEQHVAGSGSAQERSLARLGALELRRVAPELREQGEGAGRRQVVVRELCTYTRKCRFFDAGSLGVGGLGDGDHAQRGPCQHVP